jgi:biopolymer transport protein ExbD
MAYGPSKNRSESQHEPREPNLIPIMNLFIVVIPMLMTIMVSVHLAMIEITLPSSSGGGAGTGEEQVEDIPRVLTLALFLDRFEIKVEGVEQVVAIPQLAPGKYDYSTLDMNLAQLDADNPNQGTMEILPDPDVSFDTLLRSIDLCKSNNFPNIKYLTASTKYYQAK